MLDDEDACDLQELEMIPPESEHDVGDQPHIELSAAAACGFDGPQMMKVLGLIGDFRVAVMIDSGATHCFVSPYIVKRLTLAVDTSAKLPVRLGDGNQVLTTGLCTGLCLTLASADFIIPAYVFPVTGLDIILGVSWLASLGDIRANWATLSMSFVYNDTAITIRGTPGLERRSISSASSLKLSDIAECYVVWQLELAQTELPTVDAIPCDICDLLREFSQVLNPLPGLPPSRDCDHRISLIPGSAPVSIRPYRYSASQKTEIEKLVDDMLSTGLIQPSTGPYSSLVLLVHKKDGSWRFCVDYRELNKCTVPDKYPIPVIQELLDELHGAQWFSRLDLRAGYHQIRLAPEDISKTGFWTHSGHYEWLVMPFGLQNAPSTFQAAMNDLFRPFLRRFILVFFDDILIYSPDWASHVDHLRQALSLLASGSFVVNPKKCAWAQRSIDYLGHVVSVEGVKMDPSKVLAVLQWPMPHSVKGV